MIISAPPSTPAPTATARDDANNANDANDADPMLPAAGPTAGGELAAAPAPAGAVAVPSPEELDRLVHAEADGEATSPELAVLEAHRPLWRQRLIRLLDDVEERLESVRRIPGEEREQVVADFEGERRLLVLALARLEGVDPEVIAPPEATDGHAAPAPPAEELEGVETGVVRLQLSWVPGRVVAWAGGHEAPPAEVDDVRARLLAAGAPSKWADHEPVKLPGKAPRAPALSAPIGEVLGWLVGLATTPATDQLGASAVWLGKAAVMAVRLVAQGRFVPQLNRHGRGSRRRSPATSPATFNVRWAPAVVDREPLAALADGLPGSVTALERSNDPLATTRAVIADVLDAIATNAAGRLEVPAPPPKPRTKTDAAESFLANLGGATFELPEPLGAELTHRLQRWARPVTDPRMPPLVVRLDEPDAGGAWHLAVLSPRPTGAALDPVEVALNDPAEARRQDVADQLARLQRLFPAVMRPGGRRRGEVVLGQDEAWQLMTGTGEALVAAGFDLRVPTLARRSARPALRLTSEEGGESVVGARQLTAVRWSAVFDDVELDAAEIARLAAQARPMVRSRGRWVALDHADLAEAAAALAERASKTTMTGAEMLRHALGLEGTPFSGGTSLAGGGWAVDLLRKAGDIPADPTATPEGFSGRLRSYQAEAVAWLRFLDDAGLGGCLALDMGLGKTPVVLAHLRSAARRGPALVVAPPAVVGNWAAEAARFVPDLTVVVHHGAQRASPEELAAEVEGADVVITTYGTAVRDVEALRTIEWARIVLDEAQAIKNPLSETARQLRTIPEGTRLALTGTPIENGLGDLWAIMDFVNPGLVGARPAFVAQLSQHSDGERPAESALRALNGVVVFRRTKSEPDIAAELPDRIDELDHCTMTPEQIGLYQAVLDDLVRDPGEAGQGRHGRVLAAITALKQICNHPAAYQDDDQPLHGRSGKLARLEEIVDSVFAAEERLLIFTHFARWGDKLATHLSQRTGIPIACYHGGLSRPVRDRLVEEFQQGSGAGALVLSLKAGGSGLNLTAASHVVLYDRWWNPAVEDQARDRAWRIGQTRTVISHRLVCPGTVDERVEEVVAGKRRIAELVLPKSSSIGDLEPEQLRAAFGLGPDVLVAEEVDTGGGEGDGDDGDDADDGLSGERAEVLG